MELTERVQRPLLAGVLFLDIVEYSRLPVEQQYAVKKHFNRHLGDAIGHVPPQERLMLDTGDGAAVCFFAQHDAALLSAIRLRHATMFDVVAEVGYELRTGLHLGAVRVIRDLNERLNVVGDGINDAQRIMSFAAPAQILASAAFHDLVARSPRGHARLFTPLGARQDKHGKEHIVFEIGAEPGRASQASVSEGGYAAPARMPHEGGPVAGASWPRGTAAQGHSVPGPAAPQAWHPDDALLQSTRAVLVRLLGPVADPMIRRAVQSAGSAAEFHLRLAAAIDSDDDRMTFLEMVGALGQHRR